MGRSLDEADGGRVWSYSGIRVMGLWQASFSYWGSMRCPCREDDSRVRDRTAARNLAILRKIAINLISRGRTARISIRARRKQAAWNDDYMLSLLAG